MRKVNIGDLVKHVFSTRVGIILRIANDRLAGSNHFDVLWTNGKTGYNLWDYDLELISESR
jgi:hypothetical protein